MIEVLYPRYAAHETFVDAARSRAELWRLLVGSALIALAYVILSQIFFAVVLMSLSDSRAAALVADLQIGATPASMFLLLFHFGTVWVGVALACILIHKRSLWSNLGPLRAAVSDFIRVLLFLAGLGVAIWVLPPWSSDLGLERTPAPGLWLTLLPLSLFAVLLQSGAEELLFRGYLQQQLAARFKSPIAWMFVPSALFAAGHFMPGSAGDNALLIALWAGLFGILMADLTARAGNLGPAIAIHFTNNVFALVVTALPDQMSGLALYTTPFGLEDEEILAQWLPVDFALMVVMWLCARWAIAR